MIQYDSCHIDQHHSAAPRAKGAPPVTFNPGEASQSGYPAVIKKDPQQMCTKGAFFSIIGASHIPFGEPRLLIRSLATFRILLWHFLLNRQRGRRGRCAHSRGVRTIRMEKTRGSQGLGSSSMLLLRRTLLPRQILKWRCECMQWTLPNTRREDACKS